MFPYAHYPIHTLQLQVAFANVMRVTVSLTGYPGARFVVSLPEPEAGSAPPSQTWLLTTDILVRNFGWDLSQLSESVGSDVVCTAGTGVLCDFSGEGWVITMTSLSGVPEVTVSSSLVADPGCVVPVSPYRFQTAYLDDMYEFKLTGEYPPNAVDPSYRRRLRRNAKSYRVMGNGFQHKRGLTGKELKQSLIDAAGRWVDVLRSESVTPTVLAEHKESHDRSMRYCRHKMSSSDVCAHTHVTCSFPLGSVTYSRKSTTLTEWDVRFSVF
mgnify:FL=1